jgi:hypothetical protein
MGFCHALLIAGRHYGIGGADFETIRRLVAEMNIRRLAHFCKVCLAQASSERSVAGAGVGVKLVRRAYSLASNL